MLSHNLEISRKRDGISSNKDSEFVGCVLLCWSLSAKHVFYRGRRPHIPEDDFSRKKLLRISGFSGNLKSLQLFFAIDLYLWSLKVFNNVSEDFCNWNSVTTRKLNHSLFQEIPFLRRRGTGIEWFWFVANKTRLTWNLHSSGIYVCITLGGMQPKEGRSW